MADMSQYAINESFLDFLIKKEQDGDLIKELSAEFTSTGVKITHTPATGKTFHLYKAWLVPSSININDITIGVATNINRYCFVSVEYDGTEIDEIYSNNESDSVGGSGMGGAAATSQKLETSSILDTMVGDGAKAVEVEVKTIDGTAGYKVGLIGWLSDT